MTRTPDPRVEPRPRAPASRVDWGQFAALLAASIKLDIRSSRSLRAGRRLPPLVSAVLTYLVMGTILAAGLMSTREYFVFSLFTLSAAMFMTALSVIMEYNSVVVSPDDHDTLAHRPVSSTTYFWAKAANLFFYVAMTAMSLSVPAAIMGGAALGGGARFAFLYLLVALVACTAVAALIVLVYSTALKVFSYQKLTSAITYVHALATLVLTLGYILLPRMFARDPALLSIERGAWVYAAPSAWFAGTVELLTGAGGRQDAVLALIAVTATIAVVTSAMSVISLDYSRRISELAAASPAPEPRVTRARARPSLARVGLALCRNEEEKAGFELMHRYMLRDRKLRAKVYPAFGLPLAVYIYGLVTGGLHDPFVAPKVEPAFPVQELLGFYTVFITLFFASAITQSEQWKASWVFYAAPVENRGGLNVGARKLIIWRYLVPFFGILLVLLSFAMPPVRAALYLFMTLLLALVAFALLSLASPYMPLSQTIEKTRQARQIGLIMLLGISMAALVAIQQAVREMPGTVAIIVFMLVALALGAEVALRGRLARRLATEEFLG